MKRKFKNSICIFITLLFSAGPIAPTAAGAMRHFESQTLAPHFSPERNPFFNPRGSAASQLPPGHIVEPYDVTPAREKMPFKAKAFFTIYTLAARFFLKDSLTIEGLENLAVMKKTNVILAGNHRAIGDAPLVVITVYGENGRWVHFVGDANNRRVFTPGFHDHFHLSGGIPIDHGTTTRRMSEMLRAGKTIGIFPSDGVRRGLKFQLGLGWWKTGAVYASLQAGGVPIIPFSVLVKEVNGEEKIGKSIVPYYWDTVLWKLPWLQKLTFVPNLKNHLHEPRRFHITLKFGEPLYPRQMYPELFEGESPQLPEKTDARQKFLRPLRDRIAGMLDYRVAQDNGLDYEPGRKPETADSLYYAAA